ERSARPPISRRPAGTYESTDWLDDDGIDPDPIPLTVALTVTGDRMIADFTGSAPQVRGGINSPLPFTKSAVYATVRHLIGGDPPNNEGYFRPIEVIAPPGTIVKPVMPAAVAARGLTGFRLANALFGALAQIAPTASSRARWAATPASASAATIASGGPSCSSSSSSAPGAAAPAGTASMPAARAW